MLRVHPLLVQFAADELGQMHATPSFLVATLFLAVPMGLVLVSIYAALCKGAQLANLILGLF